MPISFSWLPRQYHGIDRSRSLRISNPFDTSMEASLMVKCRWCRNIDLLSIAYAHRPQLRSRLTLGGRALPRKPWVYGGPEFNRAYRYSCLHSHLWPLHRWLPFGFDGDTTLPYHDRIPWEPAIQSFGMSLIANHFRRGITR